MFIFNFFLLPSALADGPKVTSMYARGMIIFLEKLLIFRAQIE